MILTPKDVGFKTNIKHKLIYNNGRPYYKCNRAVGSLHTGQMLFKTSYRWNKVTCQNCIKQGHQKIPLKIYSNPFNENRMEKIIKSYKDLINA